MATLRPFRAIRPVPEKAAVVAAVPYDVVNREEAAALAEGNPLSFLRVSRPEIDLDPGVPPYSDAVYAKAAENYRKLREQAPLITERSPAIYLYRLRQGAHSQIGVAAAFSVREYDEGTIRRHERTRPDKEDDRTRHVLELRAQTGPAYLAYRGTPEIDALVALAAKESPLYDFTAPDGVGHTVWAVADPEPLLRAFARVPRLYIADGHHRTASASRACAELAKRGAPAGGPHESFLAVAFPAEQLRILPYHRVVRDLNGQSPAAFLASVGKAFEVSPDSVRVSPDPERGAFAMFLDAGQGARWYGLRPKHPPRARGISALDVSVLQEQLLSPILGISDPRRDSRIDFVGGIRGTAELERLVASGRAAVAFSVHATSLEDLMSVADADEIMPPKSTWFEPKLRDGLLSHSIT